MEQQSAWSGHHKATFDWADRLRAAGVHLGLSAGVALLAGLLVFALWYPYPFREISGGRELFLLVVGVDVALGPLVTFAIFDRAKRWTALRRDLAVVALLQLAGLGYGLWTVELARPIHMVFEEDRFRVVHQVDLPEGAAAKVPAGIDLAPLTGPTPLAVRPLRTEEKLDATLLALQGLPPAARPELWQPYDTARARVLQAAQPASRLQRRFPERAAEIDAVVRSRARDIGSAAYLPLVGRAAEAWTVLVDARTAEIIGYLPLDPF